MEQVFTDAQRTEFEERGYVHLGRVLGEDSLRALQERIDAIMLGEVPYEHMRFQLDSEDGAYGNTPPETVGHKGPTLAYRKIMDLEQDPLFCAICSIRCFARSRVITWGRACPFFAPCL